MKKKKRKELKRREQKRRSRKWIKIKRNDRLFEKTTIKNISRKKAKENFKKTGRKEGNLKVGKNI